jgi:hypothetical protein
MEGQQALSTGCAGLDAGEVTAEHIRHRFSSRQRGRLKFVLGQKDPPSLSSETQPSKPEYPDGPDLARSGPPLLRYYEASKVRGIGLYFGTSDRRPHALNLTVDIRDIRVSHPDYGNVDPLGQIASPPQMRRGLPPT